MSKMYQVIDTSDSSRISEEGFARRQDAKMLRNRLNAKHDGHAEGSAKPRFVVCRGEDHPRGPTDGHDHTFKPTKWI